MVMVIKLSPSAQKMNRLKEQIKARVLLTSSLYLLICQWFGVNAKTGDGRRGHVAAAASKDFAYFQRLPFLAAKLERSASALHAIPGKI